jgi:hypothetical protein
VMLQSALSDLCSNMRSVHEEIAGLRTTIVEDRPLHGDLVLIEIFGEAADDLLGWLEEALVAAMEAQQMDAAQLDLTSVQRSLAVSQAHYNRVAERFTFDLTGFERMLELTRVGRERGGEWKSWVGAVREAVGACQRPVFQTQQSYIRCWQELLDQAVPTTVTVRTA